MKDGFRQSMAWLHTWSGLLVCWVLFLVFAGGTASYFRDEISLWMKPELHATIAANVTPTRAAENALRALQQKAPDATRWFVTLPDDRAPTMRIAWQPPKAPGEKAARFQNEILDSATGEKMATVRETRGGEFLYRLHYDLHYMPALWARWIVGFCAMFMLVAIISGVITHKRIFKDFFTFRRKKGQRSWLDAHNALAVLALPYHLMITYTGLITLMFLYMPAGYQAVYNGDQKALIADVFPSSKETPAAGKPASLTAIAPLLAQAAQHWNGGQADRITVNHPGDANATIVVTRQYEKRLSYLRPSMRFNGVNGALISSSGDEVNGAAETRGVLYGLHMGHFSNPLLRMLFFICGLAGCAMVATGALLWAVKKRQNYAKVLANGGRIGFGLRLVDGMNIGTIAGLPIAFATYFWANRLLPVVMENRPETEIRYFFIAWAIAMIVAHVRPTRRMWQWQLGVGGFLFMALPILNALTTDTHLGVTLFNGPLVYAGFDLIVLSLGCCLAYTSWKMRGKSPAIKAMVAKTAAQSVASNNDKQAMPEAT
ncbi:MAG TPA: PepSY-associated TM helix domain-containing protein [Oxalicibacterium sp.]|uniref:PepSY-associated TM helix domain-containing protein n=1 Tax=Oxalicibacterium sp. TaxID=2766525 RepID=UPI002CFDFFE2|nr:PepSY-associated TM helix domain-containing protein [Oxalicibacterium sp.]HWU98501.1 PepSY-associated TM helix domain-containing protein [Oxalicibacterium sp.]